MSRIIGIYALQCPFTQNIYYVGKSTNFDFRIKTHLSDPLPYTKSLKDKGTNPIFILLEEVNKQLIDWESYLSFLEIYWIEQCRQWGFKLVNVVYNLDKQIKEKSPSLFNSKLLSQCIKDKIFVTMVTKNKQLTNTYFANEIGMSKVTFGRVLDEKLTELANIVKICKWLERPIDDFIN